MPGPWDNYANKPAGNPALLYRAPAKATAPATGYAPAGGNIAPQTYIPGSGEDPSVIARNAGITANIQASKAKDVAAFQNNLQIRENAIKNYQNANAPIPLNQRFDNASGMRKELEGRDAVKTYKNALPSYASALRSPDTPAGDQDMIYAFAKIMDPNSVVREGEAQSVADLGTVGQKIAGDLNKQLNSGGKFTPELRAQLRQTLAGRLGQYNNAYTTERRFFSDVAKRNGLDPADIVGPHLGDAYAKIENKYFRGDENKGPGAAGGVAALPANAVGGTPSGPLPGATLATGATHAASMDPKSAALINGMIQQGLGADQINAVLKPAGIGSITQDAVDNARKSLAAGGRLSPQYEAPNSLGNKIASSGLGVGIGAYADAATGGLSDEVAGAFNAIGNGQGLGNSITDANARKQAAFGQHPWWAGGGQAVGTGVQAFTGGSLLGGGALAQGLGRAAPYVGGGVLGAFDGVGSSNDNRGLGAILGGLGGAVGTGAGQALAVPAGAAIRGLAGTAAGQAVGDVARQVPGLKQMFGARLTPAPALGSGENALAGAINQAGPDALRSQLAEAGQLGVPMSLADTSPQLTSLAGSAVRRSPYASGIAEDAFLPRGRNQIERLGNAVERDLGPVGNVSQLSADLTQQAKTAARPLFEALDQSTPISSPDIDSLLNTPFGREAAAKAQTIAANKRLPTREMGFSVDGEGNVVLNPVNADAHGNLASARSARDDLSQRLQDTQARASASLSPSQYTKQISDLQTELSKADSALEGASSSLSAQPTPGVAATTPGYNFRTLRLAKQGMDDVLEQYRNPISGKLELTPLGESQNQVKNQYLGVLDNLNQDYPDARQAFAGPSASRDALARGRDAFRLSPDELGMQVATQSPEHLNQMQLGYRSELMNRANNVGDSSNPFNSTLGTPNARARVDALYPGNAGNANLFRTRDLENSLSRSQNDILGNSKTAQRLIADQGFAPSGIEAGAHGLAAIATGGASLPATGARFAGAGLSSKIGDVFGKRAAAKADELAPLIFNTDPTLASGTIDDLLKKQAAYQAYVAQSRPTRTLGMFGAGFGSSIAPGY